MNCRDKDLSPEAEFVESLAAEGAFWQAFNSSVVERAQLCNSSCRRVNNLIFKTHNLSMATLLY